MTLISIIMIRLITTAWPILSSNNPIKLRLITTCI